MVRKREIIRHPTQLDIVFEDGHISISSTPLFDSKFRFELFDKGSVILVGLMMPTAVCADNRGEVLVDL